MPNVSTRPACLLALALAGACRPVSVVLDCPPSVEADTQFDIVVTADKSGGDTDFDLDFSWSSPNPYLADITYVAVDDEPLDPPEDSGYLTVSGAASGDTTITAVGTYCPSPEGACWGTLTVGATALKSGLGEDRESDSCIIEYTAPGGGHLNRLGPGPGVR